MKRLVICVLAFTCLVSMTQAAEISTKAGTKALVFQFSGLSNLGLAAYQGGFGARYYISDAMAIRPGLVFGIDGRTEKAEADGVTDDLTANATIGMDLALEMHRSGPKAISPYWGAGIGFRSAAEVSEPSRPSHPSNGTLLRTTESGATFDLYGLLGFEWGFSESMTLGGEYRVGLGLTSGSTETERQGQSKDKSNETSEVQLGFSAASLFLSVAF